MSIVDDVNNTLDKVSKLGETGLPITVKHEFDLPSVSYTALVAFFVVVAAVILTGVKDVIVHRVTN